ncbi:MAG: heparinase II/III family protein [Oribacterium sp.]|nr:heparinase II/III family protein [Oribacterium sp.]MBP3804822.1 heparinase II/III family protein [Oribacterium sp.]
MSFSINNSTEKNPKTGSPKLGALSEVGSFISLPDISHRHFWDSLPSDYKRERLALSEKALSASWSEIFMSDYLRFSKDGNRVLFEEKFFTRRRMLTHLVMGECIENKGSFLAKILDGIYLILGETSWCLPAHNSYIRDTKQYSYPDTSRPVVDLFAAETAAVLSVAEKLLRPALKKASPFISSTIDNVLYERVLAPYLHFHFWWKGNGLEPMCNWTPWITQNILLTAFTRPYDEGSKTVPSHDARFTAEKAAVSAGFGNKASDNTSSTGSSSEQLSNRYMASPQLAELLCDESGLADPPDWRHKHLLPTQKELSRIYDSAVSSVHHFLDEYAEDGCCDEGAQYYSHAGLCLFGCLSLLRDISGSFSDALRDNLSAAGIESEFSKDMTKLHNIATYIMKVHIGDDYYVNFADCSPHAGRRGAREYLFGALVSEPAMMDFAARDYRHESWTERLSPNEENLWYHVLNAQCHELMMDLSATSGTSSAAGDAWFPSTGLMVTRDSHYVLAAKAGDNADSHNHNDVGSFILYKDKKPFIIDLGVGSYTKKTFSKDRYDIWTMQSQYHNLPSFYDAKGHLIMEHDGADFRATDVICHMDEAGAELSMELRKAYPKLDGRLLRTVRLKKDLTENHALSPLPADTSVTDAPVIIKDCYDGKLKLVENIICYEKPEPVEGTKADSCIIRIGAIGALLGDGFSDIRIEELPVTDARLGETWKHSCYRIQLTASQKTVTMGYI